MISTEDFLRDGFVHLPQAFSADLAAQCAAALWDQLPEDPADPSTWDRPVARLGYRAGGPFAEAVNSARLHFAYDTLVGAGRWAPRHDVGTFAIRFPSDESAGDDGWHLDASFPPEDPALAGDPFSWRVNLASRGRALLLLMLFTEVGEDDAPTRLRRGSHREVARLLEPHGDAGLSMIEASQQGDEATRGHEVASATGGPGDVYLCHPFLIHAAQGHAGTRPRILAQPPLHPAGRLDVGFDVRGGESVLERSLRMGSSGGPQ